MGIRHTAAALVALSALGMGTAHAAPIFSDNFNGESYGVPASSLTNFTIGGSVDVIGNGPSGSGFDFFPGNGYYIDLDGTPAAGQSYNPAGQLTTKTSFGPGTYLVSFDLGGNQRGAGDRTTDVSFGNTTKSYTLADSAGLTTFTFLATVTGSSALTFSEAGDTTFVGNILDNVSISVAPVPLPASAPMFGAALVAMGALGYRLKRKTSLTSA